MQARIEKDNLLASALEGTRIYRDALQRYARAKKDNDLVRARLDAEPKPKKGTDDPNKTLRDAIEQYGRQQDDELHDTLLFVMSELVNFFCTWLSSTKEPEVRPMATDCNGLQRIATDGDGRRWMANENPSWVIATDCDSWRLSATECD
jgi:hypothetical protein